MLGLAHASRASARYYDVHRTKQTASPLYLGIKLGYRQKVAELQKLDPLSTSGGRIGLHRQRFQRYGPIFKTAIFRHETWIILH